VTDFAEVLEPAGVGGMGTQANGTAERRASEALLKKKAEGLRRFTVGEDQAYDTGDHVATLRRVSVTPHAAQNDRLTNGQAAHERDRWSDNPPYWVSDFPDLSKDDGMHLWLAVWVAAFSGTEAEIMDSRINPCLGRVWVVSEIPIGI
jgi:hypothetical protein